MELFNRFRDIYWELHHYYNLYYFINKILFLLTVCCWLFYYLLLSCNNGHRFSKHNYDFTVTPMTSLFYWVF